MKSAKKSSVVYGREKALHSLQNYHHTVAAEQNTVDQYADVTVREEEVVSRQYSALLRSNDTLNYVYSHE